MTFIFFLVVLALLAVAAAQFGVDSRGTGEDVWFRDSLWSRSRLR
jgi:hypothetical protein